MNLNYICMHQTYDASPNPSPSPTRPQPVPNPSPPQPIPTPLLHKNLNTIAYACKRCAPRKHEFCGY